MDLDQTFFFFYRYCFSFKFSQYQNFVLIYGCRSLYLYVRRKYLCHPSLSVKVGESPDNTNKIKLHARVT